MVVTRERPAVGETSAPEATSPAPKPNPLHLVTLRFAVIALLFYGLSAIEGMMMRAELANIPLLEPDHYYAVLNAHPLVGIFGYSFMLVMGAFYFL
ncbi:MAG: hypothetical protein HY673_19630, partial [Chloroflexi bacterium]|nr:hypothetical protein [Chloroflexota bacterium]